MHPHLSDNDTTPAAGFVWWSTERSVAASVNSALAAAEVVFAVTAYWAIAVYFETTTHLWGSICLAPLLLMRSPRSVALGVQWFENYRSVPLEADLYTIIRTRDFWIAFVVGLIATIVMCYLLAWYWPVGNQSWWLSWRNLVTGYLIIQAAIAGTTSVTVNPILTATAFVNVIMVTLAVAVVGVIPLAVGGLGAVLLALWAMAVVEKAVKLGKSDGYGDREREEITWGVAGVWIGLFLGTWSRSIAIRFAATFCFLLDGFWEIPENFRRTLFVIDLLHPAEMIPGYKGEDQVFGEDLGFPNTSTQILNRFITEDVISKKVMILIAYVVFFIPAYLYRVGIKSTCWLYLPLVYIASERDITITSAHFLERVSKGGWEPWRRFLALVTLIAFCVTTLTSFVIQDIIQRLLGSFNGLDMIERFADKIISPIEFMFQLDFNQKWWQYCSLASAVITFWIWLEAKDLRIDIKHAHDASSQARVAKQVDRAKFMMRVRNVASAALILMIGIHALLDYSPISRYLPAYILSGLAWFYGDYMPPPIPRVL